MNWSRLARISIFLTIVAALLWAGYRYVENLPPNLKPWAVPDLEAAPERWAKIQLNRLKSDPKLCAEAIGKTRLQFSPIADRPSDKGCVLTNVLRYESGKSDYSRSFLATCPLAAALYWYEGQVEKLAQSYFGVGVERIDHVGSYACRNIYASKQGNLSQHATANAIDITGFRLSDGTVISVTQDWKDGKKAQFLRDAHQEACGLFNAVLGPDYNEQHRTHFHLDMGGGWICR